MSHRSVAAAAVLLLAVLDAAPCGATQFRRVTSDSTRETDPAPSPDGKWLAFSSDRSGSFQVWVMPLAGGPARQLTSEPESLTVQDPARPDTVRSFQIRASTPAWAPDSKSILFVSTRTGSYNVYSIPLAGGEPRVMASPIGNNRFATYSPDGSKIAFYSNRLEPGSLFGFNVYVMDSAGESPDRMARQLTNSQGSPGHPTWSPNGRWIAYVSKSVDTTKTITVGNGLEMKQSPLFASYKLWKSPAGGGEASQVSVPDSVGQEFEDTWPTWSPVNPRWIAVGRRVGTKQDIWIIDAVTGHGFPLTRSGTAAKPTWTRDGKAIYYCEYPKDGNEDVWVATGFTLTPKAAARTTAPRRPAGSKKTPPGGTKRATTK